MIIARHTHTSVSYLLKNRGYESVQARLKEILSPEEAFFFASAENRSTERLWYADVDSAGRSFSVISEDDKNEVSDLIASFKEAILPKLLADRELAAIAQELFIIPSEDSIFVFQQANGSLKVCITQWACRSALGDRNVDHLAIIVRRPKPDHTPVTIWAVYSDRTPYAKEPLFFHYKDRVNALKTDTAGKVNLGMLRDGTTFWLGNQSEQEQGALHAITVIPGQETYEVVFPFLVSLTIQVVNQKGALLPGVELNSWYDGESNAYTSDAEGKVYIPQLVYTSALFKLQERGNESNEQEYTLNRNQAESITFVVDHPEYTQATVRVLDQNGQAVAGYPFSLISSTAAQSYRTDQDGQTTLWDLQVGKEIVIEDDHHPENRVAHTLLEGHNEIVLRVEILPAPMVQFKVINHKNEALPGVELQFNPGAEVLHRVTDAQGSCQVIQTAFTNGSKIPVKILVPSEKNRTKKYNKNIQYSTSQLEYIIKLKRSRWLWWLLLLLLPLLLLIRCEKTVYVKTVDAQSQAPISGATVHFDYYRAYLYDQGRFLTNDFQAFDQKSNDQGIAEFGKLKYSIYSLIFKNLSPATTFATSDCYSSDTLNPRFHHLGNKEIITLKLHPGIVPFDFQVIDSLDQQPLPDAKVDIVAELNGIQYTDSGVTGADGRVVFNKIPRCSNVLKVIAREEGYLPDSLLNKPLGELLDGPVNPTRLLKLRPQLGTFSFFVIDCKSKKPIPNADLTIEIDYNGRKNKKTKKANIRGVGKGYAEDYLIAKIHISGQAPYYKPGELAGWHLVKDFMDTTKYPIAKRTFCLEPDENCVTFVNTDERTGNPLSGVTNLVTIKNGSDERKATLTSDGSGVFTVCSVRFGDKISIISQYPPDYEDNSTTVQDMDGIKLIKEATPTHPLVIPLKPKEVELTFRTIDEATDGLVPDAALSVSFDGVPQPDPTSSGPGEFTIKVPITAQISIEASKPGFGSNTTKINNTSVKAIMPPAPQVERDIPLAEDAVPCNQEINASQGFSETTIQIGSTGSQFNVEYNMRQLRDLMTIYCGKGTGGKILFQGMLQYSIGSPLTVNFDARECRGYITIVIDPEGFEDFDSSWEYTIFCPDN